MTHEEQQALIELFDGDDIDCRPYKDYSGRGMCGKTTQAIVIESRYWTEAELTRLIVDAGLDVRFRMDSFGRSAIIY